jgi:hypothetical protein
MEEDRAKRYLEWLISGLLIGVVVLILFGKLNRLAASTERESVQQTLSAVRMGIQIFIFKNMLQGKHDDLSGYENTNPMDMLSHPPGNYAGAYSAEQSVEVPSGRWYFDLSSQQLAYRMTYSFEGANVTELRYRLVRVLRGDAKGAGNSMTDGNKNFVLSLESVESERNKSQ